MADTDIWMPLYVDDYIADTRHLSTAEHGAYFLLILHAWRRGGALPGDPERLRRIAGMSAKEWKIAWPELEEMFQRDGDGYRHKRVDKELDRAKTIREQRSEAGKASAARMTPEQRKARASAAAKARHHPNGDANGATNGQQSASSRSAIQPQPQPQSQEEEDNTTLPIPHRALAFSGGVIRVNQREFDSWAATYHGIPDLRATLAALDEWIVECAASDHTVTARWKRMVTSRLDRKHQEWLAEMRKPDDEDAKFTGPC